MYAIESGVPLTIRKYGKEQTSGLKAALSKLQVGQSFTYPRTGYTSTNSASATVHSMARNIGISVATRKIDETTMRVWRLS